MNEIIEIPNANAADNSEPMLVTADQMSPEMLAYAKMMASKQGIAKEPETILAGLHKIKDALCKQVSQIDKAINLIEAKPELEQDFNTVASAIRF